MHGVSHELGVQPTRNWITAHFMQHPRRTNRVYRVVMLWMSCGNRHFFTQSYTHFRDMTAVRVFSVAYVSGDQVWAFCQAYILCQLFVQVRKALHGLDWVGIFNFSWKERKERKFVGWSIEMIDRVQRKGRDHLWMKSLNNTSKSHLPELPFSVPSQLSRALAQQRVLK